MRLLSFSCLFLFLPLASAFALDPFHASPLPAPLPLRIPGDVRPLAYDAAPPLPLTISRFDDLWDGMPRTFRVHAAPGNFAARIRMDSLASWTLDGGTFSHRWLRSLRVVLEVRPPARTAESLDPNSWQRHLAAWRTHLGSEVLLHLDDDSARNPQILPLLGARTRILELSWPGESRDAPRLALLQLVIDHPEGLVLFTITGTAAHLRNARQEVASLVQGFELHP